MCGICGIFDTQQQHDIAPMVQAMHHRGPDDSGLFTNGPVSIGFTRLSIIDTTSHGHQPMSTPDEKITIVYNGETYNYKEERQLLERKGHTFHSTSDTEVVLHMYQEYGDNFLKRLRGMYALALYDRRGGHGHERLLLARDPLGIKPLLYSQQGSAFIFASEMKSLMASSLIKRIIDPESLRLLLTFGSIPQPRSMIKNVSMLMPGHYVVIEPGRTRTHRFWGLGLDRVTGLRSKYYADQVDFLRHTLNDTVKKHLVSDVPIGAFLSGGVDSSLLVAMMAQEIGKKVKTFSVGFTKEGAHLDETDDALRIASFLGTDHTRVEVTGHDVRESIRHIAQALDQPSVDGVNSYFVSRAARTAVTVAISGTGGDELFAGYPWFWNMARYGRSTLHTIKSLIKHTSSHAVKAALFDHLIDSQLGELIDRVRASNGFNALYARQYQIFGPQGTAHVLSKTMKHQSRVGHEPSFDISRSDELPYGSALERTSALCLRGYTQNQLLRDIDAVSMSHSLEVRVPFLDHVLVDTALSLPDNTKLGSLDNINDPLNATYRTTGAKKILIDAGRKMLPPDMDDQTKHGFGLPFDSWLKGPLHDVMEETLSKGTVKDRGLFDPGRVMALKQEFQEGRTHWTRIWLLMVVELWCQEVLV